MNYTDKDIIRESKELYEEIDSCISDLITARMNKDAYEEGKAIFVMESLMVNTMQHLSCMINFLEEE